MSSGTTSNTNDSFQFPDFYHFPPFFTIQPVLNTREKQFALWRDLILRYHTEKKLKIMKLYDCPLWKNNTIHRQLDENDILFIVEDFVRHGNGEWVNENNDDNKNNNRKTHIRILWRKPEQLALDIYTWAENNGYAGSGSTGGICTLYELHSGEDIHGMSFQGADEELLLRALQILQQQGKCTIFQGDTSSEHGIKFS